MTKRRISTRRAGGLRGLTFALCRSRNPENERSLKACAGRHAGASLTTTEQYHELNDPIPAGS
jgi:hypothetical protein